MILLALLMTAAPHKLDTQPLKAELVKTHGEAQRARIEQGVDQVAALWRKDDGDLGAFVKEQFLSEPLAIDQTFATRDLARGMARNARRSAPAGGWWASKLPGTQSARAGHASCWWRTTSCIPRERWTAVSSRPVTRLRPV